MRAAATSESVWSHDGKSSAPVYVDQRLLQIAAHSLATSSVQAPSPSTCRLSEVTVVFDGVACGSRSNMTIR